MRKHLAALAALSALALPASAQAAVTITVGTTSSVPGNNDFQASLASMFGLTQYTTAGASIMSDATHVLRFDFLGSESGYSDTFTANGSGVTTWTETSSFENHFLAPITIGWSEFLAGNIGSLLGFTTSGVGSGGSNAGIGDPGFGIFLEDGLVDGDTLTLNEGDSFYLGFDDQISPDPTDDNHDDFIVRATVLPPVPEPSTWLLMILGFGAIGFGMRQRNRTERIRFNFA